MHPAWPERTSVSPVMASPATATWAPAPCETPQKQLGLLYSMATPNASPTANRKAPHAAARGPPVDNPLQPAACRLRWPRRPPGIHKRAPEIARPRTAVAARDSPERTARASVHDPCPLPGRQGELHSLAASCPPGVTSTKRARI
ncbi:hypothetical protein EV666_10572 [Camelimonas lactis]|uniref:Uncharacterized protein n=1 Tax=Camelimonas lactis TaxID=659006 RepID=A0A4R2GT94_9HYPH|nr:hypothetical protein EV666_10572 [Camelimonas lactis]